MPYKVSQSAAIERLIAEENFLSHHLTGDKIGDAYHVRSVGHLIGLIRDGVRYVSATDHGPKTAGHQMLLRTAWGEKVYTLTTAAGIAKAAVK